MNWKYIMLICFLGSLLPLFGHAQCKSYSISDRGDTLNCTDKNGVKQGPWIEKFPELRGNPGYEEEGVYKNGLREGLWRKYSLEGDLISAENYKWGLLNGKSQYYSLLGLEREEGWWAIDPGKPYDTIDVPDLFEDGIFNKVVIKNEGRSMKHGTWTVYDPMTGRIQKTEQYIRDSAVDVLGSFGVVSKKSNKNTALVDSVKKVEKPSVVEEWEKKNSGKKKVKVRTGSTGF